MTTASLKIAFIGCSHFSAHDVPGQEKNNWTYQLYKKYPQHQYRNYSKGGQGIEYYEWHLLDAKTWGADIVFVNRTYMGRWALKLQANHAPSESGYRSSYTESNWEEVVPNWDIIWGSTNSGPYMCWGTKTHQDSVEAADIERYFQSNLTFWRAQYNNHTTRLNYELKWYGNLEKLYNFDNLFLMDWNANTHEKSSEITRSSTTWDIAIEQYFLEKYIKEHPESHATRLESIPNWCVSDEDPHFGPKANLLLLNDYILTNPKVKKALNI